MTTRELFIQQKDLRDQWVAVVKQTWFLQVLAYAKAELHDSVNVTTDELRGAKMLEGILLTLGDVPDADSPIPSSGIDYSFDKVIRKADRKPEPQH